MISRRQAHAPAVRGNANPGQAPDACAPRCCAGARYCPAQGVQAWVLLRSPRGALVGAVQLALRLASLAGHRLDACLAAPPPLEQTPAAGALAALLPPQLAHRWQGLDPELFQGQWCR